MSVLEITCICLTACAVFNAFVALHWWNRANDAIYDNRHLRESLVQHRYERDGARCEVAVLERACKHNQAECERLRGIIADVCHCVSDEIEADGADTLAVPRQRKSLASEAE